jgi:hypothetical protein
MTASSIQDNVRSVIATALASVSGNVYNHVPESIIPPAVVIIPDSPYLEMQIISKTTIKCKINLTISACVAYNSNPGSLDNLEKLILSILAVIPAGYEIGVVERPTVTQVGASNLLVADIRVSTVYNQTN